jgi:hypothetical protein
MPRTFRVFLSLLCCLLVLSALPLAKAEADQPLAWDIPYPYSENSRYPLPDLLPDYLGITREDLTADSVLHIDLKPEGNVYELIASFTAGEHEIRIIGEGDFGYYQQSPLQMGEFICQTADGVDCKLYLTVYAPSDERKATIVFGENTPKISSVTFGQSYGNMSAISTQVSDRLKAQAKLPAGFQLDGKPLVLNPAPLIIDNQLLIPVRSLLTALGADVAWNASSQTVKVTKGETTLYLSLAEQTRQLSGGEAAPILIHRAVGGHLFCPLQPVAEALGASVLTRRDGSVALISREQTLKHQGVIQLIFVSSRNLIIQNDSAAPLDLGGWILISTDMSAGPGPMLQFYFPGYYILQPGEQVQVSGELTTEPDNHLLFDWTASGPMPDMRSPLQILINNLQPGRETITLQALGSDQYLGNWRLLSIAGKPAFNLPDRWLGEGQTCMISGRPGEPQSANELRWPNLPNVEAAYHEEQALKAERDRESHQRLVELYAPLTEALGLTDSGYHFYSELETGNLLLNGEIAPFNGQRDASRALMFVEMRLMQPRLKVGDHVPVYYVSPDGQTAYIGMIKQDGSLIAYRLQQVIDDGYYTWSYEQMLPA